MDIPLGTAGYSGTSVPVRTASPFALRGVGHSVCWKSIVAGAIAAMGIQLILTMIGLGAFAARVNPATDPTTATNATTAVGAAAWLIISGVISFGIGGMIAGHASAGHGHDRLAGETAKEHTRHKSFDGGLHGALAWCLAAVLGVLATTMAGATLGGGAAAGAGQAAGSAAPSTWSAWSIPGQTNGWRLANESERGGAGPAPSAERSVLTVGPYGERRYISEADARAMAEHAAEAASKATLTTALAFAVAMAAATLGAAIARAKWERAYGYATAS